MKTILLGKRTGLTVSRSSFGALPMQRIAKQEAVRLVRAAYDGGITLFDTANAYTDSEEKLGLALAGIRQNVVVATKSFAGDADTLVAHLDNSLRMLRTDYIDIFQFHNPDSLPPEDGPLYQAALKEKRAGKIRFLGVSNHKLENAVAAAKSGLYDVVQYPLSCLSSEEEIALMHLCREGGVGVLAMKAMCGGLLGSARYSMAFLRAFEGVTPLWGFQRMSELEEVLSLEEQALPLDGAMRADIERLRGELAENFCRGCGYCLPCPAGIPIDSAARLGLLLRRSPDARYLTEEFAKKMARIEQCLDCGACESRCPYHLPTRALLRKNLADYRAYNRENPGRFL